MPSRPALLLLLGIGFVLPASSSPAGAALPARNTDRSAIVGIARATSSPNGLERTDPRAALRVLAPEKKARARSQKRVRAASAPIDLSALCSGGNCDAAFASLAPGGNYFLPAGVWTFSTPFDVPSNVSLSGDGTGVVAGTDLVYTGTPIPGAVITAGAPGTDWVNGHISSLEIETQQLHDARLNGDNSSGLTIDQAGVGLEIVNPTSSSTVDGLSIQTFGASSIVIDNKAASPGTGVFQLSQFFLGGSPRPLEVRGSRAALLIRYGGIDLGPASQLGALFRGDASGAPAVLESVKVEANYDVPAFVVTGNAPVVAVGSTRYLTQSLYVQNPVNTAPAFLYRNPGSPQTGVLQCLSCTALGEETALALPDLSLAAPTSIWGIDLSVLSTAGKAAVVKALAAPETPPARPHDVVNLAPLCSAGNCDAAFGALQWGGRYYLPAGVWTFTQPFTIPSHVTFFGDGPQPGSQGGTELQYVGPPTPGGAAVTFGPGGDLSWARLFSMRIDTGVQLTAGFGLRVVNATNASSVEDVSISGFPDGQMLVDDGGEQPKGPGPNFFRIARFSLSGGVHPLQVVGGRENLLIEQGTVNLGPTSHEGVYLADGEWLAATAVVESVTVAGAYDVPGFRVASNAADLFVSSVRTAGRSGRVTSPGFLYATPWPKPLMQCLQCVTSGLKTAFVLQGLGVSVTARNGKTFDYLNQSTPLQTIRAPLNTDLPSVSGAGPSGASVAAASGSWTNSPSALAYQWLRCAAAADYPGSNCSPIAGATGPSYTLAGTDLGQYVRVTVSASNASGTGRATSIPMYVPG